MQGGKPVAKRNLKPVSVEGIEFDALIDESRTLSATIPAYPVESGYPVSDTIILSPITIQLTLFVSCTPVTGLYRHGSSNDRVNKVCDQIESLWFEKKLVKIVTSDAIYKDMGITSISIKKSKEIGYAREIVLSAQKVLITGRKTTDLPSYVLKSGQTKANAGTAATSKQSGKGGSESSASSPGSGGKNDSASDAKKNHSILYGVADGIGLFK